MIPNLEVRLSNDKLGYLAPVFTINVQCLTKLLMLLFTPHISTQRSPVLLSFAYLSHIILLLYHLLIMWLFGGFRIFFECARCRIRLFLICIRWRVTIVLRFTSTLRLILLKPRVVLILILDRFALVRRYLIFAGLLSFLSLGHINLVLDFVELGVQALEIRLHLFDQPLQILLLLHLLRVTEWEHSLLQGVEDGLITVNQKLTNDEEVQVDHMAVLVIHGVNFLQLLQSILLKISKARQNRQKGQIFLSGVNLQMSSARLKTLEIHLYFISNDMI